MGLKIATVAGMIAVGMLASCKTNEKTNSSSSIKSDETAPLSVSGQSAQAIFDVIKATGIKAETIDGHIIIGASTFKIDSIRCMTIMNADQTNKCVISKDGKYFDMNEQSVASKAVNALDKMGARVDKDLIGAVNYEIDQVTCTRPIVRIPVVTCYYEKHVATKSVILDADQSDIIFEALALAGIKPESVNGQVITGSTSLKADQMYCDVISDASRTTSCAVSKNGNVYEIKDNAIMLNLSELLFSIGAVTNPEVTGSTNLKVKNIQCSKVVYPGAHAGCTVDLAK